VKGDSIIIEAHHRAAAQAIVPIILPVIESAGRRYTISVAGQSGSGKTETATAIAQALEPKGLESVIFHQDDYFVHPPRTNDATRRADINWVGTQEVHLDLMDRHLAAFIAGDASVEKPLVNYETDSIGSEILEMGDARVALADGTYTTLLEQIDCHVFIDRDYLDTRAHREKRKRDALELDPFIDQVLEIEHRIISANRPRADIIIHKDYSVSLASDRVGSEA
jgi:uridine kinase